MRSPSWMICMIGALLLPWGAGCKKRSAGSSSKGSPKRKDSPPRPCKPGPLGPQAKKLLGTWIIDVDPVLKENAEWKNLRGPELQKVLKELKQMTLTFTPKWMEMKGPEKTERLCWEAGKSTGKTISLYSINPEGKGESIVITWLGPDSIRGQGPERRFYFKRKR